MNGLFFPSSGSLWNLLFLPGILKFPWCRSNLPWCRSIFINFSGCLVDSFSLGDSRALDLESFLTFSLIVSSLPFFIFAFWILFIQILVLLDSGSPFLSGRILQLFLPLSFCLLKWRVVWWIPIYLLSTFEIANSGPV